MSKKITTLPLAESLTKAASGQTYYTIRFLADHELMPDAYKAYGYFRWLDDQLDQDGMNRTERLDFVNLQKNLMERCFRGDWPHQCTLEEQMLVDLIRNDREQNSGLQIYIRDLLAVMEFDAQRRGRLITLHKLEDYSLLLSRAVTEAMHCFIGHNDAAPRSDTRYLAVTGAHITHMLRDTYEDLDAGYFNVPLEFLQTHHITPYDIGCEAQRGWVESRVRLARACFKAGRFYLAQIKNLRYRLAVLAYMARFEGF
jgi:phytoene/squalene synthetase